MTDVHEILDLVEEQFGTTDVDIVVGKGMVSILSKDFEIDYPHYRKDVRKVSVLDVYKVCQIFNVQDPSGAIQHIIKKLLVSGVRGAKGQNKDRLESLATLVNFLEMEGIIDVVGHIQQGELTIKIKNEHSDNLKVDKNKGR